LMSIVWAQNFQINKDGNRDHSHNIAYSIGETYIVVKLNSLNLSSSPLEVISSHSHKRKYLSIFEIMRPSEL